MNYRMTFMLVLMLFSGSVMAIEEPKFILLEKEGPYELRSYEPRVVAETVVPGSMDQASGAGFRLIADYIFGNNLSRTGESQKIEMTAPVNIEPQSEKISMTAPVSMEQLEGEWRVQFFMPSQYTIDSLPQPNNPAVSLRTLPAKKFAVVRFSGFVSEEKKAAKSAELLEWLEGKNINPHNDTVLARYNPPWTLPFLRRNEVMIAY